MPETDRTQRRDKILIAAIAALAALITFAVYLPALKNGFVNWDDPTLVYYNLHIQSIDLDLLKWAFKNVAIASWFPLTIFSFALDYALWGLDPWGFHLTNNILHALNAALVFILCVQLIKTARPDREMRKTLIAAAVAALLFGLHPLRVESVAWVTERKDVLYALFFLLSVIVYLRYVSSSGLAKKLLYASSLCLFAMSVMSKSMAVTLPMVLLVLDYYPLKRLSFKWAVVVEKIPFLLLSLGLSAMTTLTHRPDGALGALEGQAVLWRLLLPTRNYIFYLYKLILPVGLAPYYPYPENASPFSMEYVFALIIFTVITLLCVWMFRRQRLFLAVWLYYLVTLLPVIGLIKFGEFITADRYTYLSSIGPFMLAGLGVAYLMGEGKRQRMMTTTCAATVILAIFAVMTIRQTAIWKDSLTLWSYTIKLYPNKISIAYNNRGLAYEARGDLLRAITDYDTATQIDPGNMLSYLNRGIAYGVMGDYRRAIGEFNKAIDLAPEDRKTYMNRGVAYLSMGDYRRAVEDLESAIQLDPSDPIGYYNLGLVYLKLGERAQATTNLKRAAAIGLKEATNLLAKEALY